MAEMVMGILKEESIAHLKGFCCSSFCLESPGSRPLAGLPCYYCSTIYAAHVFVDRRSRAVAAPAFVAGPAVTTNVKLPKIICVWRVFMNCATQSMCQRSAVSVVSAILVDYRYYNAATTLQSINGSDSIN